MVKPRKLKGLGYFPMGGIYHPLGAVDKALVSVTKLTGCSEPQLNSVEVVRCEDAFGNQQTDEASFNAKIAWRRRRILRLTVNDS